MKNDNINLYVAVQVKNDAGREDNDTIRLIFDNNHSGNAGQDNGDDYLEIAGDNVFHDRYVNVTGTSRTIKDDMTESTGTRDGAGAAAYDTPSKTWFYEIVHPLQSGDFGHDFNLFIPSLPTLHTVGFGLDFLDKGRLTLSFSEYDYVLHSNPTVCNPCTEGELAIIGVETTQAIQCVEDPASQSQGCVKGSPLELDVVAFYPLVRNKITVVRVYVDSGPSGTPNVVSNVYLFGARLNTGQDPTGAVALGTLTTGVTAKDSGSSRGQIDSTANFQLPSSWLDNDNLILTAFVKAASNTFIDSNNGNNNWMREHTYELSRTRNLDVYVIPINIADFTITGTAPASGSALKDDPKVKFVNMNNNRIWDNGETIVYDNNGNGEFDSGETTIAAGSTTLSRRDDSHIRYVDNNNNGVRDSGESVIYDANGNHNYDKGELVIAGPTPADGAGTSDDPLIKYVDADNSNTWNSITRGLFIFDEVVFIDSNNNGALDTGEPVINPRDDDRISFSDSGTSPNNKWDSGESVVYDNNSDGKYNDSPLVPSDDTIQGQQDYMRTIFPFARITYERGSWQQVGVWTKGVGTSLNIRLQAVWLSITLSRVVTCILFHFCKPVPDIVYGILQAGGGIAYPTWWDTGTGLVANGGVSGAGCLEPCPSVMAHEVDHDLDRPENTGETVIYDNDGDQFYGDPVIAGKTPASGTALRVDPKLKFVDLDNNRALSFPLFRTGESVVYDGNNNGKYDPRVKFVDSNGDGIWNLNEKVVFDLNSNGLYDTGETMIVGAAPANGAALSVDLKIRFVDSNNNGVWNSGETVIYDLNDDSTYDAGDFLVAGTAPASNTKVKNGDGEPVISGPRPSYGGSIVSDGKIKYVESTGDTVWSSGETVVYDGSGNGSYDCCKETVIAGIPPIPGTFLNLDIVLGYIESDNDFVWKPGETVVYDLNGDGSYETSEPVIAGAKPANGTPIAQDFKISYVEDTQDVSWSLATWGRHVSGPRVRDGPLGVPAYGCGAGAPDPSWPWTDDDIHEVGLDTRTLTLISPSTTDLMSYCWSTSAGGPPWISGYRWQSLLNSFVTGGSGFAPALESNAVSPALEPVVSPSGDSLLVSGSVSSSGGGRIESVLRQPGEFFEEPGRGDYSVVIVDQQGNVLAGKSLNAQFVDIDGNVVEPYQFAVALAYPASAVAVQLRRGAILIDEVRASPNPPFVQLLSPNGGENWSGIQTVSWRAADPDGDPLTYTLEYSPDGGNTWSPLETGLTQTSYRLDTSQIPGSNMARLRVLAVDGFYTSQDDSDSPFIVEDKPPTAHLLQPTDQSVFTTDDTVLLIGEGQDLEDGSLSDNNLAWSSSIDGFLGTGGGLFSPIVARDT